MFPVAFVWHAGTVTDIAEKHSFPGTVNIVTGHAMLWGWCVAAFRALTKGDVEHIACLWQSALTASIQMHIITDARAMALLANQQRVLCHRPDVPGDVPRLCPEIVNGLE